MISPAVAYVLIAASANVIGAAAVTSRSKWSISALAKLVALSAGFMISVALLDLIPESIAQQGSHAALIILGGYVLVHLTQHTLTPHFHFGEEVHQVSHSVSTSALIGLLLHTFVDGVAIASGFEVSRALGLLVFVAILLHKLPEGLAISSLFLAAARPGSGLSVRGHRSDWRLSREACSPSTSLRSEPMDCRSRPALRCTSALPTSFPSFRARKAGTFRSVSLQDAPCTFWRGI